MLLEVFEILSGGVGIISVVLSLFRRFERFLGGGGRYFQGNQYLFSCAWEDYSFLRGLNFPDLRFSQS